MFLQEARGWRQGLRPSLGTIRGTKLLVSSFPSTNHHNLRIGNISFTKTRTFLEIFNTLFSLPLISGRFCLRDFWPLFSPPPHLLLLLLPEKPHTHAHTNADTHARAKEPLSQERTHTRTHGGRKRCAAIFTHSGDDFRHSLEPQLDRYRFRPALDSYGGIGHCAGHGR